MRLPACAEICGLLRARRAWHLLFVEPRLANRINRTPVVRSLGARGGEVGFDVSNRAWRTRMSFSTQAHSRTNGR